MTAGPNIQKNVAQYRASMRNAQAHYVQQNDE